MTEERVNSSGENLSQEREGFEKPEEHSEASEVPLLIILDLTG